MTYIGEYGDIWWKVGAGSQETGYKKLYNNYQGTTML
jgi:hypothetical protein